MQKIYVKSYDHGFFTQKEIPVTRLEKIGENETHLVFCNHGGAEFEEVHNQIDRIDEPDIVWTDKVYICGKCKAYRFEGESEWHDSPSGGVHYE